MRLFEQISPQLMWISRGTLVTIFFLCGVLTSLNDVLIPHLKYTFDLSYFMALLIQLVWFLGYFVISYPASMYVNKTSYKHGMVVGFMLFIIGCLFFCLAAELKDYAFFLFSLFIIASGVSTLQVVGNSFGSALGTEENLHKRLMFFHACFAIGTTITPWISGPLILNYSHSSLSLASRLSHVATVIPVYAGLSVILVICIICVFKLPLPNIQYAGLISI